MKKSVLAGLLVVACTSATVWSNGSSETASSKAPKSEFAGQTVTLMLENKEGEYEAQQAQIKAFEKKYGCKVEVEVVPTGAQGENLRKVRVATHALPDVFGSAVGAIMMQMDPVNNCLPLDGQPWIGNVNESYRKAAGVDGKTYGVPTAPSNVGGVFYNKKVFEKYGISIPETWDQFLSVCEKLKQAGVTPVAHPNGKASLCQVPFLMDYYYVEQADPDFATKYTKHEIGLADSEEYVYGLQKLYDLAAKGYLNEDSMSATIEDVATMLGEGTAAMSIIRSNLLSTMSVLVTDAVDDIGFFPLPDKSASIRGVCTWMPIGYFVTSYAKNQALALKFVEFMTTQEAIDAYVSVQKPTGAFMLNGIHFAADAPVYKCMNEAQEWIEKASTSVMEYKCPIKGANMPSICQQVAVGQITPAEAIKAIEEDNALSAKQLGIPGWI